MNILYILILVLCLINLYIQLQNRDKIDELEKEQEEKKEFQKIDEDYEKLKSYGLDICTHTDFEIVEKGVISEKTILVRSINGLYKRNYVVFPAEKLLKKIENGEITIKKGRQ